MIDKLKIENFKSIRNLELNCKKINVFIGEPNAGKSNVIEALTFLSEGINSSNFKDVVRYRSFSDLFYDRETTKEIIIIANSLYCKISFDGKEFKGVINKVVVAPSKNENLVNFRFEPLGSNLYWSPTLQTDITPLIKCFFYRNLMKFDNTKPGSLLPPFGENLITTLSTNKEYRRLASDIFKSKGLKIQLDDTTHEISVVKEIDDVLFKYPYESSSETLRRIVFFMGCLETNKNSTLLFDEPEANTFPFYTKYLAERISADETNQYFLTTHNPYLLESIVAKSAPENLNVVITYMEDYETKLKLLNDIEVKELMNLDAFFNLKRYTETE